MRQALRLLRGIWAFRRGAGAVAFSDEVLVGCRLLSLDVFDTLLLRPPGEPHLAEYEAAAQAARLAERRGAVRVPPDAAYRLRHRIARKLARQNQRSGRDAELRHAELVRAHLAALLGRDPRPEDVEELLVYERERILATTRRNEEIVELARRARDMEIPVIAVSDTYLSSAELGELLAAHGAGVDRIFSSSERGRNKVSGRLFTVVLEELGRRGTEVLHVGDNFVADVCSARAHGLRALWYRGERGTPAPPVASAPVKEDVSASDQAFIEIGATVFGPVLCTFGHHLLLEADRAGCEDLFFVARDGDLLLRVTELLAPRLPLLSRPKLRYAYLSRRSTALAASPDLDLPRAAAILEGHAANRGLAGILASLNLPLSAVAPLAAACGIRDPAEPISEPRGDLRLRALFSEERFRRLVADERTRQRNLLRDYLTQEGFFEGRRVALVDLGWSGTIQDALVTAFSGVTGFPTISGYYVGLGQDPLRGVPELLDAKSGLLGDPRRGRSLSEAAVHYAAALFEAVCRADHGSVLGYRRSSDGRVEPVFHVTQPSAESEAEDGGRQDVREGVLACARSYAEFLRGAVLDEDTSRRQAQRLVRRLAFFPTRDELRLGGVLSAGDVFREDWRCALVPAGGTPLWRAPRAWLRGLRAPWRSGWVAATGGRPLALAFATFESILLRLPRGTVAALRRWFLARAGLERREE